MAEWCTFRARRGRVEESTSAFSLMEWKRSPLTPGTTSTQPMCESRPAPSCCTSKRVVPLSSAGKRRRGCSSTTCDGDGSVVVHWWIETSCLPNVQRRNDDEDSGSLGAMAAYARDLPGLADHLVALGWDCGSAEAWVLALVRSPRSPEHFASHSGRTDLAAASGFSRGRRCVVVAHLALVVRRPKRLEAEWPCDYCFVRNPHRVALGRSCRIVRVVDRLIRGPRAGDDRTTGWPWS